MEKTITISFPTLAAVKAGLSLYAVTNGKMQITSTRKGGGITNLLNIAELATGRKFKRTEAQKAADAVKLVMDTMLADAAVRNMQQQA